MGFFKKNWRILVMLALALFNGIIGVLILMGQSINYFIIILANFCLSIIYPIIEAIDKIAEKSKVITVNIPVKTGENIEKIKADVAIVKTEILKEKKKVEDKKNENRILVDLINNNFISAKTLDNNILDKKFISVLCYQAGFNERSGFVSEKVIAKEEEIRLLNKKLKEKGKPLKEEIDLGREYSKMFEELGFIRLAGHNPFFIVPQDNIYPEKLRDLDKISDYLIKEGTIIVGKEWEKLKDTHKQYDLDFYNSHMGNINNPVNLNMLIIKINRRDMRHRFVLRNDFSKEFSSELSTIVKLNQFKTSSFEKTEIRNLVLQSSLKILILSLAEKEREKILTLESEFTKSQSEGGLGIVNFYDYHTKNIEDIKRILKKSFRQENKIKEYAEMIFKNSKDFQEDLIKLGRRN
jgi:hypothetical protein